MYLTGKNVVHEPGGRDLTSTTYVIEVRGYFCIVTSSAHIALFVCVYFSLLGTFQRICFILLCNAGTNFF